jgi:hypothetical protein
MKSIAALTILATASAAASAQACWSEWERKGEWLLRAGSCQENVSIANTEKLCRSRVAGDEARSAPSCPTQAKLFFKGQVLVEPVEFRCMGQRPPGAGGASNVFYYGLTRTEQQTELIKSMCTQVGGAWESGPR